MNAANAARATADALALVIALIIALRMRPRRASLRGLFASKSPESLQLFFVSLVLGVWYLTRILAQQGSSIPPIGNFCLWAFGISCTLYAVGKAVRTSRTLSKPKFSNKGEPV